MSNGEQHRQDTQHAFLVAWSWFAEHLGLSQQLQALSLKQKHYHHRLQTAVLEFLVAILAGLQHLQNISRAAHPLDQIVCDGAFHGGTGAPLREQRRLLVFAFDLFRLCCRLLWGATTLCLGV
jgi:hypothetical protein